MDSMRQETVEDWVQVLMEREVLRKDWVSSGVRVRRLGVLGEVPWSRRKGATSLVGGVELSFSFELSSWRCARLW